MAKATLILSFYNKLEILRMVLASLELQTVNDFEIIIADDGSADEVVEEIRLIIDNSKLKIKHCWHADEGWRKNRILNQAVKAAESDHFIFIDSDCLLHEQFVAQHIKYIEKGTVLAGRRVNLSEKVTKKLSIKYIDEGYLRGAILKDLFPDVIRGKGKDIEQGFYFGSSKFGDWLNRKEKGILGSNFSIYRDDFYNVNGFDERFTVPAAGEDTDIEHRLLRNGCKIKTIRNRAIQYHVYHKELPRKEERLKFLDENDAGEVIFTPYGIDQ